MSKKKERVEKLKKELEKEDLNVSSDALFMVSEIRSEIRDTRNILLCHTYSGL